MSGAGVYGLQIGGLDGASHLMGEAWPGDPGLEVVRTDGLADLAPVLDADRAVLRLSDGQSRASLRRGSEEVRLQLARSYGDEELLHPLLAGSFAVHNWWHGRDAFHAGAFVSDGRAWGLIGHKGHGKSTLLAHLARRGIPVTSDDVLVEVGGTVRPGPAFIDLRPDAAEQFGLGRPMGVLGTRPRFRLDLEVADAVPLAGWLLLAWGERTALTPVPPARRVPVLLENRAVLLAPADPVGLLRHAGLPFFELTRPRAWSALDEVADLVTSLPSG